MGEIVRTQNSEMEREPNRRASERVNVLGAGCVVSMAQGGLKLYLALLTHPHVVTYRAERRPSLPSRVASRRKNNGRKGEKKKERKKDGENIPLCVPKISHFLTDRCSAKSEKDSHPNTKNLSHLAADLLTFG